ncbi:MAG TPA: dihydroorotate dehydrogenase electron transfer subunit [Lentimicrobium sp.]|nr:dihydroorotate dehydrogenase electron transfer subunit [Lentimicrobium sp.]
MKKYISDFSVVSNVKLNSKHNILELKSLMPLPEIAPGQFVEVKVEGSETTYLRRPFSIHRVDYTKNTMHLLIKVVGDGTRKIALLEENEIVNMMFPLGKGFNLTKEREVLLVGGGCGVAPLYFLAEQLHKKGNKVSVLIGGRSSEDILLADEYRQFGQVFISTEDGTLGEKGMVTAHSIFKGNSDQTSDYSGIGDNIVRKFDKIYCCGPDGMMRAIAHIAEQLNIPCEVSLENTMACGIGACLCCVVESVKGNVCVCTEGPVFDSTQLNGWTKETEVGCSLDK